MIRKRSVIPGRVTDDQKAIVVQTFGAKRAPFVSRWLYWMAILSEGAPWLKGTFNLSDLPRHLKKEPVWLPRAENFVSFFPLADDRDIGERLLWIGENLTGVWCASHDRDGVWFATDNEMLHFVLRFGREPRGITYG